MAASIKIQFDKINKSTMRAIKKSTSKSKLQVIAKDLANDIRVRTRLGKGVKKDLANPSGLKKLSAKYKLQRKKDKKKGNLSEFTTPNKSNLTRTGQLLESISGKSLRDGSFEIYLKEGRNDSKKNTKIKDYQEDQGRYFFNISRLEYKRVQDKIRKDIAKNLEKEL